MANRKCFNCNRPIKQIYLKKKVRCPYCGYKILYKPRSIISTVQAV